MIYLPTVDYPVLSNALQELNEAAEGVGLEAREIPVWTVQEEVKFDPYKSAITSTNLDQPKTAKAKDYCPTTITEQMRSVESSRDVRLTQAEIAQIRVDRHPQVFAVSETGSVNTALQAIQDAEMERLIKLYRGNSSEYNPAEDGETPGDLNSQLSSIKAVLDENEKRSRFQNKRKMQLEQMKKSRIFTHAIIRVRFPDRLLLQGSFSVLETLNEVYAFVAESIVQSRKFYLYLTPPKQVLKASRENLKSFAPATIINFAWADLEETRPSDGPFLNEELVSASQSLS